MIVRTLQTNFAIQVITFVTSILVARILGPTGRGELSLVLLYPQLVAGIALLGVDRAVAVLGGRGELTHPVATIIKLALLFSIPAMLAGYATVIWRVADAHLAGLATTYLIYVPAMLFFLLAVSLFNGTGDFSRFNQTRLGFYSFNFALVLALWLTMPSILLPLDWVLLANLAAVYGALALAVWMLRDFKSTMGCPSVKAGKGDVRTVLGMAVVFALPGSLAQFSSSAYQIALEHLMDVRALGFFVVFLSYSRLLSPIGSAIGSHVFHLGTSGDNHDIARITRLSLLVLLGCAVPMWIVAGWLIPMIFGLAFVVDGRTVGILLLSTLLALLADSMAEYLNGQRKVAADIVGRILYLITLGILAVLLVPQLGFLGMALAMAIGDMLRCGYLVMRVGCDTERAFNEFWRVSWADIFALLHAGKSVVQGFFARR
jgi:O-antigen/teichoic acid export membrane protein